MFFFTPLNFAYKHATLTSLIVIDFLLINGVPAREIPILDLNQKTEKNDQEEGDSNDQNIFPLR